MYGVALTVLACLRSGTRADVAWLVQADGLPVADWSDAVVFTPGGGRIGSMAMGALDGHLADQAGRWDTGRIVDIEVSEVEALIAGLPSTGSAKCLLVPADTLPEGLWDLAVAREPIGLVCTLDGDEVAVIDLYTTSTVAEAGETVETLFAGGESGSASHWRPGGLGVQGCATAGRGRGYRRGRSPGRARVAGSAGMPGSPPMPARRPG